MPSAETEDGKLLGMVPQLPDGFEEDGKRDLQNVLSTSALFR